MDSYINAANFRDHIEENFRGDNIWQWFQQDVIFVSLDDTVENIIQSLNDEIFCKCFGFDKVMIRCLLMELRNRTYHQCIVFHNTLSFDMLVLATLSYLMGDLELVLQMNEFKFFLTIPTVVRCVEDICRIIVHFLSPDYVRFPFSQKDQELQKTEFLKQFGVPGVVGVLNCYNVYIQKVPKHEESMYLNKRCSSAATIAVQLICDEKCLFLDVNPRFSGSTRPNYIWTRSHINSIIQNAQKINPNTWLVADRKYHLSSCVVNPYRKPKDIMQESVNIALNEIQTVALKSYALLKARFRCLDTVLPFDHENASNIISACVTLHNFLISKGQQIDENLSYNVTNDKSFPNARYSDELSSQGMKNRDIIQNFMHNNSMQVLYKIRKNSNLSFINDFNRNIYMAD